jgi:hypothetical protein
LAFELVIYREPLDQSELMFLEKKEAKERRVYYKVFRILMFMSFLLPFAGAWHRAFEGAPNAFSPFRYFFITGILLSICTFSTYATYRINLRKIQMDIKERTKTVEINHITRKLYVGTKNAYHFYTDSSVKLSIEVSAADYERMNEGDEVAMEYTTHAKLYLGYF